MTLPNLPSLGFPSIGGETQNFPTIDPGINLDPASLGAQAAGATFGQAQGVGAPFDSKGDIKPGQDKGSFFSITANLAAFVIGVIAIGAGLLMFKTTGTVIVGAGKLAAKGASLAA